jgi:hypothetical protein
MGADETAADLISKAADHFARLAEGDNVPRNLIDALLAITTAAYQHDNMDVPPRVILAAAIALQAAFPTAMEHFASDSRPLPSTVERGLNSAGGILSTFGESVAEWPPNVRALFLSWVDSACILMSETDAAVRWRRVTARAQRKVAGFKTAASLSLAIH